ncbi:type IV pilus secretin PilQ [Candidatus Binatia bacterium]|nr:type IV pilus secretin PilQ [Candidatus Binatia bacterium]
MRSLPRVAICLGLLLAAPAAFADDDAPEIVGVEYETRVGGAGVISAENNVDPRAAAMDAAAADSAANSNQRAAAALDRASSAQAASTGETTGAPPSFVPEDELRVVDVRRASDPTGSLFVVQLSRDAGTTSPFELSAPRRCVVDVSGHGAQVAGKNTIATGDARAPQLRVGTYENRLRLVLDVASGVVDPCQARAEGSTVVLSLGGQPMGAAPVDLFTAPAAPAGASEHGAWMLASLTGGTPPASAGAAPSRVASAPSHAIEAPSHVVDVPSHEVASAPHTISAPAHSIEVPVDPQPAPRVASAPPPPPRPVQPVASRDSNRIRSTMSAPPASVEADTRNVPPPPPPLPANPAKKQYTGRRISLEFKDADILNVLRIIADVSRRNIVATDDVKGQVTIVLYDVPWDQALDILLKSTGLEMVEYDDVITVSTSKRLEEERRSRLAARQAGIELEPLQTDYIRVNYVKAAELARLLGGSGTTSASAAAATDAITGGVQQALDSPAQRRGLLSSRGLVQVNEATNTLVVRDVASGIANARELVRRLDVQTPQVSIQGLIFEADTNLDRDLGIRWGARYVASPETGNPTGRNFPGRVVAGGAGPTSNTSGDSTLPVMFDFPASAVQPGAGSTLGLFLGSLSGSAALDAEITALEQAGKGKVISRPKVITLNNAEAVIQSLEILRVRLPSTGTVINTGPGGVAGGQTTATQAIDTGIILRVTPQVSSDGYVLMQLFVKSSVPSQVETDNIPNEISRQATSQVLVREGETVVIGGVYRQRANTAESGVPYLRSVPVLGWLFKNSLLRDNRQELLVFITPRVVWHQPDNGTLPSANELWGQRDRTAYSLDGGPQPVPIEPVAVR